MKNINFDLTLFNDWSGDVESKWSPPEGFFTQSAKKIADGLKANSKDKAQAMRRLNFYINRAGSNLDKADKDRLELAKTKLQNLYDKQFGLAEVGKEILYAEGKKQAAEILHDAAEKIKLKLAEAKERKRLKELEAYEEAKAKEKAAREADMNFSLTLAGLGAAVSGALPILKAAGSTALAGVSKLGKLDNIKSIGNAATEAGKLVTDAAKKKAKAMTAKGDKDAEKLNEAADKKVAEIKEKAKKNVENIRKRIEAKYQAEKNKYKPK